MGYHYGILALGVSALILASPFVLWVAHNIVHRPPSRKQIMAIIAAFQPSIDANTAAAESLNASAAAIAAALAAGGALPAGAASAEDVTDTATALTASSEAVTTAAAAVAAVIPAPAEPAG